MKEFPDVIAWSIPAFVLLIVLERVSYLLHRDDDEVGYGGADTATSLTMGLGSIVADLHHSSQRFNLSTALRQPWTGLTSWVFYLPLIVAGVHPAVVAFCGSVNLLYQFWIHTERIDRMPRWYEAVFNTPSHHRVHHASQGSYLDRNFGGILIVWDRLFGSFAPEQERCVYGLTKNVDSYNPVRVAFHEYASIARDLRAAVTWRHRVGHLFRAPGWQPAPGRTVRAAGPARPDGQTSSAPG
ncbi:sterol desaturase family protein [Micromonospora sp. NPDC003944]